MSVGVAKSFARILSSLLQTDLLYVVFCGPVIWKLLSKLNVSKLDTFKAASAARAMSGSSCAGQAVRPPPDVNPDGFQALQHGLTSAISAVMSRYLTV